MTISNNSASSVQAHITLVFLPLET
jgi:hypothetical protein